MQPVFANFIVGCSDVSLEAAGHYFQDHPDNGNPTHSTCCVFYCNHPIPSLNLGFYFIQLLNYNQTEKVLVDNHDSD